MPAPSAAASPTAPSAGWRRAIEAAPSGLWVFADQGVVSLANFAAPVFVGRFAGQQQLGYFILGLSIFIVANALGRSLVWTAYTKRLHESAAGEHAALTGSATVHLLLFAAAAAGVASCVALGIWWMGPNDLAAVCAVLAGGIALMLLREHVRRLAMARLDFLGAFGFDVMVGMAQVSALAALAYGGRLTAATAIGAVAGSAALSVVWLLAHRRLVRIEPTRLIDDWRRNWSTSKWLAAAATSVTVGNQGYRWALPLLTSLAELGRLGAAQVVVQVTNPIVIGLSNFLSPMTARVLADRGVTGLWAYTLRVSLAMLAGTLVFLGLVGTFGVTGVRWLLGEAGQGVTVALLLSLAVGVASEALLIPIQAAIVNLGEAQLLFRAAIVRLLINLTIGFGLVGLYGAEAIGVGVAAGSVVALVWQWRAFAREAWSA